MQFLDPTNDFAFKKIFGNENKKFILISFLNNILGLALNRQIIDVTFLDPKQVHHLPGSKETILDVRCTDQMGEHYIVEMQVLQKAFFDRRILYYASKAYAHQLESGDHYHKLKPVIFLGILNFNFTQNQHYLSTHSIQDNDTFEKILKDFRFTFAELPKFTKTEAELETVEDKWLFFLKHAKELEAVPAVIHEEALKEAFEIIKRLNWDSNTMELYDNRAMKIQDQIQEVNFGYLAGERKGIEQGRKEGIEKIALALKKAGLSSSEIAQHTGLSEEKIESFTS